MPSLCVCVLSSPGQSDLARGLLELVRSEPFAANLGELALLHVHPYAAADWPGPYLADMELPGPPREGERGRADRLNQGVLAAAGAGCDYALLIEADVWPLRPKVLRMLLRRMVRENHLLGAAALTSGRRQEAPQLGLWPRLLAVDLAWQRSRRMFPLDYEGYAQRVLEHAERWEVPTLASCMSGAYFRRIVEAVPEEAALDAALTQLARFEELEPVLLSGRDESFGWPQLGITRDPRPQTRAEFVRALDGQDAGPTLARLAADGGEGWFCEPHPHPGTPVARPRRRHTAAPLD